MNAIFDWGRDGQKLLFSARNRRALEKVVGMTFGREDVTDPDVVDSIYGLVNKFKPDYVLTPTLTRGHKHVRDRFSTVDESLLAAYTCKMAASTELGTSEVSVRDLHDELRGGFIIYGNSPIVSKPRDFQPHDTIRLTTPVMVYLTDSSDYNMGFDIDTYNYRVTGVLLDGTAKLRNNMEVANVLDSSLIIDVPVDAFMNSHVICVEPLDNTLPGNVFSEENMVQIFNEALDERLKAVEWRGGPLTFDEAHEMWTDSALVSIPEHLRDKFIVKSLTLKESLIPPDLELMHDNISLEAFDDAFKQADFGQTTEEPDYAKPDLVDDLVEYIRARSIEEEYGLEL